MAETRADALARINRVCSLIIIVMGKIDRDMDELQTLRNELNAILLGMRDAQSDGKESQEGGA